VGCFLVYRFFEIGSLTTAIVAMIVGGAVFALRLYLARRSFRCRGHAR
jgi:uncharacterized membrane-anchored protein